MVYDRPKTYQEEIVDKYFKENMCVTFDKFIENWEETEDCVKYYKNENEKLKEQNKKYKEVIDKLKELIIDNIEETTYEYIGSNRIKVLQKLIMDNDGVNELLDILKGVEINE